MNIFLRIRKVSVILVCQKKQIFWPVRPSVYCLIQTGQVVAANCLNTDTRERICSHLCNILILIFLFLKTVYLSKISDCTVFPLCSELNLKLKLLPQMSSPGGSFLNKYIQCPLGASFYMYFGEIWTSLHHGSHLISGPHCTGRNDKCHKHVHCKYHHRKYTFNIIS